MPKNTPHTKRGVEIETESWSFRFEKVLLSALLVVVMSGLCRAQFNSSIEGNVTDASGSAVPDVAIRAINQQTGVTSTTKTSAAGYYSIPALPPGPVSRGGIEGRLQHSHSKRHHAGDGKSAIGAAATGGRFSFHAGDGRGRAACCRDFRGARI